MAVRTGSPPFKLRCICDRSARGTTTIPLAYEQGKHDSVEDSRGFWVHLDVHLPGTRHEMALQGLCLGHASFAVVVDHLQRDQTLHVNKRESDCWTCVDPPSSACASLCASSRTRCHSGRPVVGNCVDHFALYALVSQRSSMLTLRRFSWTSTPTDSACRLLRCSPGRRTLWFCASRCCEG